jgi:hypothetical protein
MGAKVFNYFCHLAKAAAAFFVAASFVAAFFAAKAQ